MPKGGSQIVYAPFVIVQSPWRIFYGTVDFLDHAGGWCRTDILFCFMGSFIRAHSFIGVQVFLGFCGAWFHAFRGLGLYSDFSLDPQSKSFNASMLEVSFVNSLAKRSWNAIICLLIKDAEEFSAITYWGCCLSFSQEEDMIHDCTLFSFVFSVSDTKYNRAKFYHSFWTSTNEAR